MPTENANWILPYFDMLLKRYHMDLEPAAIDLVKEAERRMLAHYWGIKDPELESNDPKHDLPYKLKIVYKEPKNSQN